MASSARDVTTIARVVDTRADARGIQYHLMIARLRFSREMTNYCKNYRPGVPESEQQRELTAANLHLEQLAVASQGRIAYTSTGLVVLPRTEWSDCPRCDGRRSRSRSRMAIAAAAEGETPVAAAPAGADAGDEATAYDHETDHETLDAPFDRDRYSRSRVYDRALSGARRYVQLVSPAGDDETLTPREITMMYIVTYGMASRSASLDEMCDSLGWAVCTSPRCAPCLGYRRDFPHPLTFNDEHPVCKSSLTRVAVAAWQDVSQEEWVFRAGAWTVREDTLRDCL